jgi:uncharacterized protein YeaO (DUF488 family)
MIKTKYIYTQKETSDGTRILIARKWPRGIRKGHFHEWYKELSPEEDTLKEWLDSKKTEVDWKKYLSKFLPQMKGSEAVAKIEELRERSKKGEIITLLCHCRPGEHCHRYIIKSKIKGSSKVIESD